MSVLIKNMAIPEKCDDCRFCSRRWFDTIFDGFCELIHAAGCTAEGKSIYFA